MPPASDIFGRRIQKWGGAITADSIVGQFSSGSLNFNALGLLIQKITLAYTQPVNVIYEIAPPAQGGNQSAPVQVYYHVGRQEGEAILARIIGPTHLVSMFYDTFGNPCLDNTFTVTIDTNCNSGALSDKLTYTLNGFLLFNTVVEGSAREGLYSEQLRARFLNMSLEVGGT